MRLGCSYNVFDGVELLEPSIKSIRGSVDYISVIYQTISNFGQRTNIDILSLVQDLKTRGLIDNYMEYSPSTSSKGHYNELIKRNLGLVDCKNAKCTHFMTIDVDEFYIKDELDRVKVIVEECGCDSSACQMQTYYKTPEWTLDPPEDYYVPLIYKIDERRFSMANRWAVSADPTRRLEARNLRLFGRDEVQMHHMSYVRKDIMSKLTNSSASMNFKDRINSIASYFDRWQPGQDALLAGREERYYKLKKVNNIFNL